MHSHHDGEVWGLCVITDNIFVTSGDDNKLLMFDMATRKCIQKGQVVPGSPLDSGSMDPSVKSRREGGASTTSSEPPNK